MCIRDRVYTDEGEQLLNTGGGIVNALPHLSDDCFVVINADVFTDYTIESMSLSNRSAHLIMVDNPSYYSNGDFYLDKTQVRLSGGQSLTFSGISYYTPSFFDQQTATHFSLVDLLKRKITQGLVSGTHYHGMWIDIGTVQRLTRLQQSYENTPNNC